MRKLFLTALLITMVNGSTVFAADNVQAANVGLKINTPENQTFLYHASQRAEATATFQRDFDTRQGVVFVKTARKFKSNIWLKYEERNVKASSLMQILSLGIKQGTEVKIIAEGSDAQEAVATLREFIEAGCPA